MTKQRKLICDILRQSPEHLTAEQIFLEGKKEIPSLAIGTVYRNLNLMADAGQIRRVSILGQPDRFDRVADYHDHLICDRCGRLTDITVTELNRYLESAVGSPVSSYELNIHYICPGCRQID